MAEPHGRVIGHPACIKAPHETPVRRLDEVKAARELKVSE